MAVVRDLAKAALREIGVLASGESADGEDIKDAFATFNRLVDDWATQRLYIYTVTRTTWTIVASTGQYAVGSGAAVNVARPVYVDHVNFIDTSQSPDREYELSKLTDDGWSRISAKAQTSTWPEAYYYNPTMATGTIDLWPVPTSSDLEGALYAPEAVSQFASLDTSVSLPPGYERMIVKNLALELAPGYDEAQVGPLLAKQAAESMGNVKRANIRLQELQLDRGAIIGGRLRRAYDIYRG